MKALIFENQVVDVASVEFQVHESMTWMECSDDCTAGEWELVAGNLQEIPKTNGFGIEQLRKSRNGRLYKSDWTQFVDGPLNEEKKAEWVTYRQALRDLPAYTPDPTSPTWPTEPKD